MKTCMQHQIECFPFFSPRVKELGFLFLGNLAVLLRILHPVAPGVIPDVLLKFKVIVCLIVGRGGAAPVA